MCMPHPVEGVQRSVRPMGGKLDLQSCTVRDTNIHTRQTCGSGTPWKRDTLEKRVHSSSAIALTLADAQSTCARGESVSSH